MKKLQNHMGKLALCFLVLLLVLPLFAACQEESTEESSASSEGEAGKTALVPSLGEADYSGRALRVLAVDEEDVLFEREPFGAEEYTTEPVNDAIVDRNALIEQEYGFTIETEFIDPFDPFRTKIINDVTSGTVTYDVVSGGLQTVAMLAAEGVFMDFYAIEDSHIDLTAPWWDVASNEDMTLMGKLFFATGDIVLLDDEFTRCIYYNKSLVEDNNLENPAELVYNNEWTLDKMYEMAQAAAVDRDDGLMTVTGTDIWGIVGAAFDTYNLIMGCDAPQVELNAEGLPQLAMMNQRNVTAFEKVHAIMHDKSCVAWCEQYYAWNDPEAGTVAGNFFKGQALFLMSTVHVVNSDELRNAEIRYGILPMPKLDSLQDHYATTCDPYRFQVISIMFNCPDTEFVTFALEALAYLSREMVTPEYYDRTLKNKRFLDDDDSPEMLDIIFSNRMVDISVAFNWDDCIQYYNNMVFTETPQLASYVEQRESVFNAEMNETVDFLLGLS